MALVEDITGTCPSPFISIRILDADFGLRKFLSGFDHAFSEFQSHHIQRVPVIRIFGITPHGQKVCCHVHGVFPYFYVPLMTKMPSASELRQMAMDINTALNKSLENDKSRCSKVPSQKNEDISLQDPVRYRHAYKAHVANIQVESKINFYGYYNTESLFLKISLVNPWLIKRTADLLQDGVIGGIYYQPFEAHIAYIQQFMCDFNLQGMNFLHVSDARFRLPLPATNQSTQSVSHIASNQFWCLDSINEYSILPDLERESSCRVECDIAAKDIIAQPAYCSASSGSLGMHGMLDPTSSFLPVNPGLVALWEDERIRRRAEGKSTQFEILSDVERLPSSWLKPAMTNNERHFLNKFAEAIEADRHGSLIFKKQSAQEVYPFDEETEMNLPNPQNQDAAHPSTDTDAVFSSQIVEERLKFATQGNEAPSQRANDVVDLLGAIFDFDADLTQENIGEDDYVGVHEDNLVSTSQTENLDAQNEINETWEETMAMSQAWDKDAGEIEHCSSKHENFASNLDYQGTISHKEHSDHHLNKLDDDRCAKTTKPDQYHLNYKLEEQLHTECTDTVFSFRKTTNAHFTPATVKFDFKQSEYHRLSDNIGAQNIATLERSTERRDRSLMNFINTDFSIPRFCENVSTSANSNISFCYPERWLSEYSASEASLRIAPRPYGPYEPYDKSQYSRVNIDDCHMEVWDHSISHNLTTCHPEKMNVLVRVQRLSPNPAFHCIYHSLPLLTPPSSPTNREVEYWEPSKAATHTSESTNYVDIQKTNINAQTERVEQTSTTQNYSGDFLPINVSSIPATPLSTPFHVYQVAQKQPSTPIENSSSLILKEQLLIPDTFAPHSTPAYSADQTMEHHRSEMHRLSPASQLVKSRHELRDVRRAVKRDAPPSFRLDVPLSTGDMRRNLSSYSKSSNSIAHHLCDENTKFIDINNCQDCDENVVKKTHPKMNKNYPIIALKSSEDIGDEPTTPSVAKLENEIRRDYLCFSQFMHRSSVKLQDEKQHGLRLWRLQTDPPNSDSLFEFIPTSGYHKTHLLREPFFSRREDTIGLERTYALDGTTFFWNQIDTEAKSIARFQELISVFCNNFREPFQNSSYNSWLKPTLHQDLVTLTPAFDPPNPAHLAFSHSNNAADRCTISDHLISSQRQTQSATKFLQLPSKASQFSPSSQNRSDSKKHLLYSQIKPKNNDQFGILNELDSIDKVRDIFLFFFLFFLCFH